MGNFHIIQNYLQKIESDTDRGYQFEKICKWFLQNEPYYQQKFTKVWLWKDWDISEKWHRREKGVDLIAQTIDGTFWAIQSKAYDQNYYLTKEDIDSFLSESNRTIITHRLLIATTNKIGPNAAEVITGQEKPVTRLLLDALENSDLDWSLAIENKEPITQQPKKPRKHQKNALTKIIKGFQASRQGQVHMACGTGKTLIGLWLAQKLASKYTLVLVPSLNLISQLYKEWTKNAGDFKFNAIFVCSDRTVAADDEDLPIIEFGYPVTTSPQDLIKALQINTNLPTVVFATYHSSLVLKDACTLNSELIFDLVIADEAHRCTGKDTSDFTIITHKNFIRAQRKLYMTATPKIYSENVKTKTQEFDIQIASMDDENKFGPVFYQLLFSHAIKHKLLCDYHVYIAPVTDVKYQEHAEKGRFVHFNESETDARTLATQIYTAKAIKKLGLKKIITFHNSVKAAKDFITTLPKALTLLQPDERPVLKYCNIITGDMPQSDRNKILKKFADTQTEGICILGNVKCLSEGVDVPAIDGIVFVDPKGSETDIIQSIGRVMRPSKNKSIGTILIPIFVDPNTDHEVELEKSCFKKVWQIVRALRSQDEMLAEELDNIRLELGKRIYKAPAKLNKITFDISLGINQSFAEAINYKLIKNCADHWYLYFGLLQQYVDNYGNAQVSSEYVVDEYKLGSWVSVQRKKYKASMPAERIQLLESLQGWVWSQLDANWEKLFTILSKHLNDCGNLNNPDCLIIEDQNVSQWVSIQRKAYKAGRMNDNRIKKLESLKGWTWNPFKQNWEKGIKFLNDFYCREGHLTVTFDHIEQGFNLGIWIRNKKRNYKTGILSKEQQIILENFANWTWDNDRDVQWKNNFVLLVAFVKLYGHARVPRGCKFKKSNLDVWCSTQRRAKSLKRLSLEQIKMLETLPGWAWNTIDYNNEEAFAMLDIFTKREGHAFVPINHIEFDFKLGIWVSKQRLYFFKGKLKKEMYDKLILYPHWYWNAYEGYWEIGKKHLLSFYEKNSHFLIKNSYIENDFALGKWVQMYRYQYKKQKLSEDKITFFNSLSGWLWAIKK